MNVKGTKKLYIIKTCEQILSFNSIKHYIQFQYNCRGWGLGVGHYPPKISSDSPRSMLLALTNLRDLHYPISGLIQSSIPNFKPCRSCTPVSKHDESSYSIKCFWVVRYSKCTSSRGDLLKHTVYIQCIYHSIFHCSR